MGDLIVPGFDDEKNGDLSVRVERIKGVPNGLLLRLRGVVDTYNAHFLSNKFKLVVAAGYTRIAFQCGELNYVSSMGIGMFTSFLKDLSAVKGRLTFVDVHPKVLLVFQLLGFDGFFSFVKDESAMLGFLNAQAPKELPFPRVFRCPVCQRRLKASRAGKFRCSPCHSSLTVDGAVVLAS